jgi:hypothetical protein
MDVSGVMANTTQNNTYMEWYEILSIIIAAAGSVMAILKMHYSAKKSAQERHKEQMVEMITHNEWKKNMEFKVATIEKETEKLKEDGKYNLHEIWEKIEKMEESHEKEMDETNCHIEKLIAEIQKQNVNINEKNDASHAALLAELNKISQSLAVLNAQFQDHKTTHGKGERTVNH